MEATNIDLGDPTWKECWNWTPAADYNLLVSRLKSQTRPHGDIDGVLIMKAQERGWEVGELDVSL